MSASGSVLVKVIGLVYREPQRDETSHPAAIAPGAKRRDVERCHRRPGTPGAQQPYFCRQRRMPSAPCAGLTLQSQCPKRGEKATCRRRASGVRNAIGRIPARIDSADQDKAGVTASREPKEGDTAPDLGRDGRCAEMKSIRRLMSVSRSTITCVNILVRQKAIATGIRQRALAEFPCYAFLRRDG
jgi:hypothetical protein